MGERRVRRARRVRWACVIACAVLMGATVVSRWVVGVAGVTRSVTVMVAQGGVAVAFDASGSGPQRSEVRPESADGLEGFCWWPTVGGVYQLRWVVVPLWWVGLACGGVAWWSWRRERGVLREGRCGACGYALAGLGEGVRCPECGAAR